eukprot:SAG31_NODE_186_length_20918_cov_26.890917_22_plen_182_part_00
MAVAGNATLLKYAGSLMCAAPLHREIGGNSFSEFLEKYSVFVSKADFKFNAAHFVAYEGFREKLHGHNYTVAVHCEAEGIQADGYVVDFGDIKAVVRKLCKELNELFLCPKNSDVLDISIADNVLRIKCQDGAEFTFPASDAAMLPIKHSTVEELSKYFVSLKSNTFPFDEVYPALKFACH